MYRSRKVLVTGGGGLIGHELSSHLLKHGADVRVTVHRSSNQPEGVEVLRGDLTDWSFCLKVTKDVDYVFHLAAMLAGIATNESKPGEVLVNNLLMNTKVLEASRVNGARGVLFASSGAVYPDKYVVCREEHAWTGPPESSNQYYGYAKLMGEAQAQGYYKEHKIPTCIVRIASPFGPWDNFNPSTSFALQSFIRRGALLEDPFVIWGTGQAMRDYVYVSDVADGMLLALDKYAVGQPLNLGSGSATSMVHAADLITEIVGYKPKIVFDLSKKDGRPMRLLDMTKTFSVTGFKPRVSLEEGLRRTLDWFDAHPSLVGSDGAKTTFLTDGARI